MKNKNRRRIIVASSITATLLVILSIAFAALSATLNINFTTVTQNALRWNVGFKGSSVTPVQEGTSDTGLSCGTAAVTPSTVTISDSTLSKPDDKCTYPLTIENTGDISANLAAIAMSQPTNMSCTKPDDATMVCGNITIKLKTESGADFTAGVTVEPGEEYDLNLIVHYTGTTLNSTPITINTSKVTFAYKQAAKRVSSIKPDGIKDAPKPLCKRATTLHTDECTNISDWAYDGCYAAGYSTDGSKGTSTITYGNLGTSGTLTSGDAFDCDVNGDGVYDSEKERFYFVSGLYGNIATDYAVMIYYSNVSGGLPTTTAKFAYHSEEKNYLGPTAAYQQLPTTEQWPKVTLSNSTRQIYAVKPQTFIKSGNQTYNLPQFTYTDRAARLLDYREIDSACGTHTADYHTSNELATCEFIIENTNYPTGYSGNKVDTYWIENVYATDTRNAWNVYGDSATIGLYGVTSELGVRPAIEVPLSQIDY